MEFNKIKQIVELQNSMNCIIEPNWINLDWDFMRASAIESCEAIEHHGWKWWKKQTIDLPQLQMEIIDIWHFIVSKLIVDNNGDLAKTTEVITKEFLNNNSVVVFDSNTYELNTLSLLQKLDLLTGISCSKRVSIPLFKSIMKEVQLDNINLFEQYIQKNVLNIFRQNNGYKNGTYIKIWCGEEDNVHLVRVAKLLDSNDENYSVTIYNHLEEIYKNKQ